MSLAKVQALHRADVPAGTSFLLRDSWISKSTATAAGRVVAQRFGGDVYHDLLPIAPRGREHVVRQETLGHASQGIGAARGEGNDLPRG
jgi:hypothetical protein